MNTWMRFGLIAGIVMGIVFFAPFFVFGASPGWMKVGQLVGYTTMVLCLTATWFAMRRERERLGGLGFGRALGVGVGVSAVAALLFGAATWVFYLIVGDELPRTIYEFYVANVRASGLPDDAIAAQLAELESMRALFFNYPLQAAIMAATVFVIGVVESLVGALVVSRRRSLPAAAA